MSFSKYIVTLLLIASLIQQAIGKDIDNESEISNKQVEFDTRFSFEHQCNIPQDKLMPILALLRSLATSFQPFMIVLAWIYLIYGVVCSVLMVRYYKKNWLSLSYIITYLVRQIHTGLLYLIYCQVTQGYETYGQVYFYIILIPSVLQIARVTFVEDLEPAQKRVIAVYFFLIILGLTSFKEYYCVMIEVICFFTHMFQLSLNTLIKNNNKNNSIIMIVNQLICTVVFYFVPVYSQRYFLGPTIQQKFFFFLFSAILFAICTLKINRDLRNFLWKNIKQLYPVWIMKRLGYKLETDTCSICWQEMNIFLGVDDIKDVFNPFGSGLIRVHRNHIFHQVCILKWSLVKYNCPLDNEPINI